MEKKKILAKEGRGEHTEKKSRFIGYCAEASTEEEARTFIRRIRAQHHDASHRVYAYQIGDFHEIRRSTDAGEPGGTAGRPCLEVIIGAELYDAVVVVVRYFGGTLLGTGGLVRAYSKAARLAIEDAGFAHKGIAARLCLLTDYETLGKLQNQLSREHCTVERIDYQNNAAIYCSVLRDEVPDFCGRLEESFPGSVHTTVLSEESWIRLPDTANS